jgi:hypothetical protein
MGGGVRIRRARGGVGPRGRGRWCAAACILALAGCSATSTSHPLDGSGPSSGASTSTLAPRDAVHQLLAADGHAGDNFGGALWYNTFEKPIKPVYVATPGEAALSSDGTVAVVGAPGNGAAGKQGSGAVYVYTLQNGRWSQSAKLAADDAAPHDALGWSVAISGDGHSVLVGAPYADVGTNVDIGAAYYFRETGGKWSQVAKLASVDSTAYDSFGWSVGLSRDGQTAIVGATGHDLGFLKDAGAAYVFRRDVVDTTKWTETRRLTAAAPSPGGEFGGAAALSADGSTAAVTELTHFDSQHVLHTGATLVFVSTDGWYTAAQRAKFPDPNHNSNGDTDAYGVNAVLSDDGKVVAIAAPDVNVGTAGGAGATFVYSTTGDWRDPAHNSRLSLFPHDPRPFLYYGSSVALSADGTRLFVGIDGAGVDDQGAAEIVALTRRAPAALRAGLRTPVAPPNATRGRFGTAVALSAAGTTALGTSPWFAVGTSALRGSAYVLTLPAP